MEAPEWGNADAIREYFADKPKSCKLHGRPLEIELGYRLLADITPTGEWMQAISGLPHIIMIGESLEEPKNSPFSIERDAVIYCTACQEALSLRLNKTQEDR